MRCRINTVIYIYYIKYTSAIVSTKLDTLVLRSQSHFSARRQGGFSSLVHGALTVRSSAAAKHAKPS